MNGQSKPASGREYEVKLDRHVRMPMSDGVELAAVVARPDAPGEFPAIVEYLPYRRLIRIEAGVSESGYNHRRHGPAWFASRGYAVVCFDVRGTGNSGGSTTDIYSERERRDGYEAVEWVAAQPWCSGAVGMWGMSFGGVVQWQVGGAEAASSQDPGDGVVEHRRLPRLDQPRGARSVPTCSTATRR